LIAWLGGTGQCSIACFIGLGYPDGLNPLNKSQKLNAISKIPIGVSNHPRFTTLVKSGKMMKTKVRAAHESSQRHTPELRHRLEEFPNLVCGVDVPVGIAKQAPAVHGGMRDAVAAAFDGVERDTALAGCGP